MHIEDEREAVGFELDFRYGNESRSALKGVKGAVKRGRCIVLCGSSGCGKSTILRCVNHLIPQFYEGELKGRRNASNLDCRRFNYRSHYLCYYRRIDWPAHCKKTFVGWTKENCGGVV